MKPQVHRNKDTLRRSEDVRRSEAIHHRDEGSINKKVTCGFSTAKKPSPQRRMVGWNIKLQFLSPSLAHFPMHINNIFLDLFRVRIFKGEHPP